MRAAGARGRIILVGAMRDVELLRRFEDDQIRMSPPDYHEGLRIFEELWRHAVRLGALPLKDPLEGIENDVHLAGKLRVR